MAKQAQDNEQAIPTEFPADQLFVAVSESAQEFVGEDGGPRTGGRGMWAKGMVGQWTARSAIPLAIRNPDDGLIWKGYLEPVTKHSYGVNGQIVCNESQKFYAYPNSEPRPAKEQKVVKGVTPTKKAEQRAKSGPAPLGNTLKPTAKPPMMAGANRASDALVG